MRKAALILLLSIPVSLSTTSAQAYRYPIALTGDSITESVVVRGNGFQGLGMELGKALRSKGFRMGGYGFVPTQMVTCCLHKGFDYFTPWHYSGSWDYQGLLFLKQTDYSPNGLAASSSDGTARVTLPGNLVGVMYGTSPDGGQLEVKLDGKLQRVVDTKSRLPGTKIHWMSAKGKSHHLRLDARGPVILQGAMASRVYHAKLPELEINQIGHGGDFAASHTTNLQMQALRSLKAKLTLIMFGANEEMNAMSGRTDYRALFRQGIKVRAQNAQKDGGKCVVVTHPPIFSIWHAANPQWRKVQSSYKVVAKDAARRYGCAFLTVWEDLWSPYTSQRQGFTLDGIHPTIRGYHLMSSRLAHWLTAHRSWWLHSNA